MVKNQAVPVVSDTEQMSKNGTLEQEQSTKQNGEPLESDVAINSEGPGELQEGDSTPETDLLLPEQVNLKESYESGHSLNDSDLPPVEEETKQSVARFESIREELKNVKEELYTHISEVDEKVCEETNLEEQIES